MLKPAQIGVTGRGRAGIWLAWAALLLPTLIGAGALIHGGSVRIAHASDERVGVAVIGRLNTTISAADGYRAALGSRADAHRSARAVEAALAELGRFDRALPASIALGPEADAIAAEWVVLRRKPDAARLSAWIERLVEAVSTMSDRATITYDPGFDTINLGDALAVQYAKSGERYARIADFAARAPAAAVPLGDRFLVARLAAEAVDAERLGAFDLSEATHLTPAFARSLAQLSAEVDRASVVYATRLDEEFVRRPTARPARLAATGRRLVAGQRVLMARIAVVLDRALAGRIVHEREGQAAAATGALLFTIVSFAVVAALVRGLAVAAELERVKAEHARERAIGDVQRELFTAEEKFRVTFEQAPLGILIVDEDLRTIEANPALEALVADIDTVLAADRNLFERALADGENQRFERRYQRPDGQFAWAEVALRGVASGDREKRYVLGTFRDVTESKALSSRLVHDATHDALTGLPNRTYFEGALRDALQRSRMDARARSALLFLDLDDFKLVNDSVGHHAGDALLVATAERLRRTLRGDAVICRMGGDEFAILLPLGGDEDSERVAIRIVAMLREPFAYDGHALAVRASIGVVALRDGTLQPEEALRDADTAMYQAKALGGGRHVVFDAPMHARAKRRMQLTTDLRDAVEMGRIEVAYQPILDLRSTQLLGFEALARWTHPTEGSVSPAEFVPLAEDSGTIEPLGRLVLFGACRQLAAWCRDEPAAREWTMNVNVAARQILSGSIVHDLRRALAKTGIAADRITLEITESVLLDNVAQANETLEALRRIGVRVCIDDFGTGYSSLQYLQRFPIDGIKVDRSFVSNGADGLASEPIVQMLVTLSRVLDLSIVVEGIETRTQLSRLIALGCTAGQGYLFSPPIAPEHAARYIDHLLSLPAVV